MLGNIAHIITKFFPLWIVIMSILAFSFPDPFKPVGKMIPYLLGIIMLSMGLTMKLDDFKLILSRPKDVIYGIVLRYLIMPLVAFSVVHLLGLPPLIGAGLILVGCCPSGTASNVMTLVAKGDIALSVTVSSLNTVLAPLLTPYLFLFLAGTLIPVNAEALFVDIVKIVLLPVALGIAIGTLMPKIVNKVTAILPVISVLAILGVLSAVVALSANRLASVALLIFVAVILHNGVGLCLGYWTPRLLGMTPPKARAISFEIGMENSGLAVALAIAHLDPLAAIPGVVFSMWHCISGSFLAGYWGRDRDNVTVSS